MTALPRSQEPAMSFRPAVLVLAVLAAFPAAAAKPAFSPMDVFALEWASDPQISPDGTQVAYVRQSFDIKSDTRRRMIWLVDRDGGNHRPLVGGSANQASPRWSPDGKRLAFVSADGDGAQIHMYWFAQGVTARVTNLLDSPARLAWSPDGRHLAFVMRVPEKLEPLKVELPEKPEDAKWAEPLKAIDRMVYRADGEGFLPDAFAQLFVVSADGGTARRLTEGAFDHDGVAWTADGAEILVSANRHENADVVPADSEVYAVDVATGAIRALTRRFGPDTDPAASPDGKFIAYTGFDDAYQGYQRARLYVMRRENGEVRELASDLDRDVQNPVWSRDSRRIYFQYDDQGTTRIAECDLSGRVSNLVDDLGGEGWSRPYGGGSFSVARDGTIAYSANDALDPAQVGLVDGDKPRRLTRLNAELFAGRELGRIEEIWSTTPADGRRVQSWLIRPPGYDPAKQYPLILEIHGGPFANYGPRFAAELQLYAAAGYNVLFSNPRGSTSYGEEFGNLIHHAYPGRDFDDLMAAVDAAIARGGVDGNRLFVTGGSGGGVLTAWIVGSTERFKAAAVQKPVINWVSFALTADLPNFFYKYWFPAPPWEDPEAYWQRSPLSRVGNVKTPTMVVTGEQDFRTPISESEQFYQALRIRGVDTLLVRVPGAPHALDQRPSQLNARIAYILAWFAKHDKGTPPAQVAAGN
ncbi:MAG TPA: S9 family peptidase [Steroidobacteraceae bacterium]|nr:S9 family peptidase [Steroidobacteraceae bacterium]